MTTTLRGGDNFDSGTPVTAALQKELKSGRKNLIINGGMKVAQRGTSFTDPASGAYALDRWKAGLQTATGAGNYTQEDDAPTAAEAGTDFIKCLKFTCTTIDTSTTTSNRYWTSYSAEGQDIAHIGFGKAGTRYVTLSFWHKHTKTGTHSLGLQSGAGDRHYASEYTQTTTETWEKATTTIPVDTSGTWATDTSVGMRLFFATHIGADYQGTPDTWEAGQGYGTANQVNNLDSTSNSMRFTGVQLELGSVATDFEHRSYGEELALCQRYFEVVSTTSDNNGNRYLGVAWSATDMNVFIPFLQEKRANPSVSISGLGQVYTGAWGTCTGGTVEGASKRGCTINMQKSSGYTIKYGYFIRGQGITADAEL